MGELEERLNAVLSNPAEMDRITRMASQLIGQISPSAPANSPPGPGAALPGALGQMLRGLGEQSGKNPLLEALLPYLDSGRSARLSRALRTASMVTLAFKAVSALGGEHGL